VNVSGSLSPDTGTTGTFVTLAVPDSGAIVVIVYDVGEAFFPNQLLDPTSTDAGLSSHRF
jgi:hypothetical protein